MMRYSTSQDVNTVTVISTTALTLRDCYLRLTWSYSTITKYDSKSTIYQHYRGELEASSYGLS